jgi:hypothetical protein
MKISDNNYYNGCHNRCNELNQIHTKIEPDICNGYLSVVTNNLEKSLVMFLTTIDYNHCNGLLWLL